MQIPQTYQAIQIKETESGFSREITTLNIADLPAGELLIKVAYSALNYKDALSATGNKGVTRHYPHTPGVDAAGEVVRSEDPRFSLGDKVIVTSYDLGMNTAGGFGQYIRVPAAWAVPLPDTFDLRQAMIMGTGAYTAALALHKMEQAGQHPDMGAIAVSGASGGVGSMAVCLLAKAGYEVAASTGKADAHDWLRELGATQVISRTELNDNSGRPLLRAAWAGAIDTVGGNTLATLLKACNRNGNVATCGLVASPQLNTTVFPFILNGVNLLGVDTAETPMATRLEVWNKLSTKWNIQSKLEKIAIACTLEKLDPYFDLILKGKTRGRVLISLW